MKNKQSKKPVDSRITQIMRTFDFKKVQDAMLYLNLTWVTSKEPDSVPTLREIRRTARVMLSAIVEEPINTTYGTGGLVCEKYSDNSIELRFELENAYGSLD